jgi:hypothetical protein
VEAELLHLKKAVVDAMDLVRGQKQPSPCMLVANKTV